MPSDAPVRRRSRALSGSTDPIRPGTTTIEGRLIPDVDRFDLGTVPLHIAFARFCNTTFAQLAASFESGQLTDATYQMWIGRDYDIPGITTLTREVAPTESTVQRAENGFGQGQVLTFPFDMALITRRPPRVGGPYPCVDQRDAH